MIAQYHPPPGQSEGTPVKLTNPAGAGSDPPPPPLHWKQTGPPPTSTRACQTCRQQITSSKKPPRWFPVLLLIFWSHVTCDFLVTCDMWPTNLLLLNHPEASPNLCFCLFWLWQNLYRTRSYIDSQQFWPASTLTQWPASLSAVRLLPCRAQCWKLENCHEMVKNSEVVCKKKYCLFWGSIYKASFLVILKTCAWIILYYSSTSLYYHQKVYYRRESYFTFVDGLFLEHRNHKNSIKTEASSLEFHKSTTVYSLT